MTDIAVKVESLSKLYKIGARQAGYKTLRESIMGTFAAPFRHFTKNPASSIRHNLGPQGQA